MFSGTGRLFKLLIRLLKVLIKPLTFYSFFSAYLLLKFVGECIFCVLISEIGFLDHLGMFIFCLF